MAQGILAVVIFAAVLIFTIGKLSENKGYGGKCFVVIPFDSYTKELEKEVKCCCRDEMFRDISERREILLVVLDGRCDEKVQKLAESMENVRVIAVTQLEDYIGRKTGEEVERAGKDKGRSG